MWQHFAILNAVLVLSAANAVTDLSDICKNLRSGDVVPHPMDCSAYFVCGTVVPTLNYCNDGLHFDAVRKICNWPENAQCNNDNNNVATSIRLHPVFMAIDIDTGKVTNPMEKYDPKNIECRHFGAYFLPHPGSCRRYYLCAYGHLHRHKCGRGTAWNYLKQECELNNEAICYSRINAGLDIDAGRDDDDIDVIDDVNIDANGGSTTPYPLTMTTTSVQASTVCFVIDTTIVTGLTTDTTFNPTGTGHTRTQDPTWNITGTYHTATPHPSYRPTATTPRADGAASTANEAATGGLKCPPKGEAYLPNVLDCSKYFICISGTPVPTTCPKDLYWDPNAEFCDLAKNVQCYGQ